VAVEVHRAGDGPSEEEMGAMFAGPGRGAKIGLHLAQRVAEAAGGALTAEADAGITFRLRLPA
jgi:hypothetical protein